tara:strand:+ start:3088 stop:3471 length:384 start_codon:yes stop_codon:yes gene_type:complete
MSDKKYRLGVAEINLVMRHLKLEPVVPCDMQVVIAQIDQLYDLDANSFEEKLHIMTIAYDALRVCLVGIVGLFKHDVEINHHLGTHLKKGCYKFLDQNVKDSAGYEPWNCHKRLSGRWVYPNNGDKL